jgi:hypothetical protein
MARGTLLLLFVVGCGGSSIDLGDAATNEAGADTYVAPVDASEAAVEAAVEAGPYGVPSTTYPAFTPWMGQLVPNGGPVLTTPVVVTITWDGDANRSTYEAFGDGLGASSYWSAAVGEWGITGATSGTLNHVHLSTTPPTTWADTDVRTFITANLNTVLPANTAQTIYVFYISSSTTFQWQGQNACNSIGGYHDNFMNGSTSVSYAVLPACSSNPGTRTRFASHEIGEASTDPEPSTSPGIRSFDDPYLAFEEWQRGNDENGDACEFFADSIYTETTPFPFEVQKLWSNKMGPLGHSPCQPFYVPYFNMAPLALEDIIVDLSSEGGSSTFKTKGYTCALNSTIKIPVGFYSDAATQPWTVTVAESNPIVNPVTGRLTLSVDSNKTSGVNGEQTFINVTVIAKGPLNAELLTIISTLGTTKHYLPLMIGN